MSTVEHEKIVEGGREQLLVTAQTHELRSLLEQLHISPDEGISVNETIQTIPSLGDNVRTLGLMGAGDESALALLIASPEATTSLQDRKILPLLIPPTPSGLSLFTSDPTSATLYTNGFWVLQDKTLQYVRTQEPTPLDGLLTMYDIVDEERFYRGCDRVIDQHVALQSVTDNKWVTRTILQQAGLPIPEGILVEHPEALHDQLLQALNRHPGGVALKGVFGSQGRNVLIVTKGNEAQAEEFGKMLLERGMSVILEERIIPRPFRWRRRGRIQSTDLTLDHNARVLLVGTNDGFRVITAEVRYDTAGAPVNVSLGAQATRLEETYTPTEIRTINQTSEAAARALIEAAPFDKHKPYMVILGMDDILSENVVVIEGNAGGVGGFGTLTRLDGKPLAAVRDVLYPALRSFLDAQHTLRPTTSGRLEQMELLQADRINMIDILIPLLRTASESDSAEIIRFAKQLDPEAAQMIFEREDNIFFAEVKPPIDPSNLTNPETTSPNLFEAIIRVLLRTPHMDMEFVEGYVRERLRNDVYVSEDDLEEAVKRYIAKRQAEIASS